MLCDKKEIFEHSVYELAKFKYGIPKPLEYYYGETESLDCRARLDGTEIAISGFRKNKVHKLEGHSVYVRGYLVTVPHIYRSDKEGQAAVEQLMQMPENIYKQCVIPNSAASIDKIRLAHLNGETISENSGHHIFVYLDSVAVIHSEDTEPELLQKYLQEVIQAIPVIAVQCLKAEGVILNWDFHIYNKYMKKAFRDSLFRPSSILTEDYVRISEKDNLFCFSNYPSLVGRGSLNDSQSYEFNWR